MRLCSRVLIWNPGAVRGPMKCHYRGVMVKTTGIGGIQFRIGFGARFCHNCGKS